MITWFFVRHVKIDHVRDLRNRDRLVQFAEATDVENKKELFVYQALFQTDCNLAGIVVERARNYLH